MRPNSLSINPGDDKGPQPLMFNPALTACASERMKTQRFSYRLDVVCLCFDSKAEIYYFAHSLNMLQIDLSIKGDGGITRHRPLILGMVLFCGSSFLAIHGSNHNTESAYEQQSNPKEEIAVIACLRNSCSGVRIVFSRSTVVIGSFKLYLCAVGPVVFNACDNRIFNIFPLRCKRNALRNGLGEIVFGITVIPTLKRITRLSWCCGFGCLITPDNILTWYFTTAIAVKFYNARNVPPMI